MQRLLLLFAVLGLAACSGQAEDYSELSIAELHDRMQRGELRSEQLVHWYLDRIETIDQGDAGLNAIIEVNPDALMIARALDDEWRQSGPRGPMHGIPVVLKANIDTADSMYTSAGSLALATHRPSEDAFLVRQLRDAGAVILAKANLSEWANFRSSRSTSGWSSVGGQTHNPYDLTRNPCGSSSGSAVAVAANLTMVAVGTETNGSVVCPAGANGIVGIKPTLGLISRSGIVPLAHSQDTAGAMARSVRDAAALLSAMTGKDASDPVTAEGPQGRIDYAANLAADGLAGRRIGVLRNYYGAGSNPEVEAILAASIDTLQAQGAIVVDKLEIDLGAAGENEYKVLLYEFKADLNAYLSNSNAPVASLAEVIEFNDAHADDVLPLFGHENLLVADAMGGLDSPDYHTALDTSRQLARDGLDQLMQDHELDALIAITNGPAWKTDHVNGDHYSIGSSSYAAIAGYPNMTVPAGFVAGLPVGLSLMGQPFTEVRLIRMAFAFEQAQQARRPPGRLNGVTELDP